jgi:hypothetical protein
MTNRHPRRWLPFSKLAEQDSDEDGQQCYADHSPEDHEAASKPCPSRRISCDVIPWSDGYGAPIIEGGTKAFRPILDTRGV